MSREILFHPIHIHQPNKVSYQLMRFYSVGEYELNEIVSLYFVKTGVEVVYLDSCINIGDMSIMRLDW